MTYKIRVDSIALRADSLATGPPDHSKEAPKDTCRMDLVFWTPTENSVTFALSSRTHTTLY
jgi:hypothetical protein